eukprot:scpid99920/ scgid19263/ 
MLVFGLQFNTSVLLLRLWHTAPGPVKHMVAMVISSSAVKIEWDAPDTSNGNILYYTLEYSMVNSQSSVQRVKVNISTAMLQYNITGLLNNSDVLITVFAVNSAGPGPGVTTRVTTMGAVEQPKGRPTTPSVPRPATAAFCTVPPGLDWASLVASSFSSEAISFKEQRFSVGQSMKLTCKEGLYVSGILSQQHQIIRCQENGTWSDEIVACSGQPLAEQPAEKQGYFESKPSSLLGVASILG